jgi:hypothetical protein
LCCGVKFLEGCAGVAALRRQGRCHVVASMKGQALARAGKAGAVPVLTRKAYPRCSSPAPDGGAWVYKRGCLCRGGRWAPPRTTSRRYRPEWGLYLTHSTPGDHTLVRPPGHWLRPHLSRPLGTTSVPWDKTVGSNQTTVSDERRWSQVCRPRGQIQGGAHPADTARRRSQASRNADTAPWRCRRSQASSRGWLRRR